MKGHEDFFKKSGSSWPFMSFMVQIISYAITIDELVKSRFLMAT